MNRTVLALLSLWAAPLFAADPAGLDLTIEVLGREEHVDERIVNRIEIPGVATERAPLPARDAAGNVIKGVGRVVTGVGGVVGNMVDRIVPPVPPALRYDEWVQQRHEAGRERERNRDAR